MAFFKRFFSIYDDSVISDFVKDELTQSAEGLKILDLGCGSQRFRIFCKHLKYFGQDFGQSSTGLGNEKTNYEYGKLDYIGNCWEVDEKDNFFDIILCTEVLEHIPYPEAAIKEMSRLLRPGGKLILTVPLASARHMDPYWFQPGLSDNWFNLFLPKYSLHIGKLKKTGSYSQFLRTELFRTWAYNKWAFLFLLPALFYYRFLFDTNKPPLTDLFYVGNLIVAEKK